jgi:alpha-ketoglutarate-dependent taurine dioxygenase
MYQINASKNIEDCLRLINYYSNNPINQTIFKLKPHEILIVDNQRFLHGRTCFPQNSKRKMQRFWFQGLN